MSSILDGHHAGVLTKYSAAVGIAEQKLIFTNYYLTFYNKRGTDS